MFSVGAIGAPSYPLKLQWTMFPYIEGFPSQKAEFLAWGLSLVIWGFVWSSECGRPKVWGLMLSETTQPVRNRNSWRNSSACRLLSRTVLKYIPYSQRALMGLLVPHLPTVVTHPYVHTGLIFPFIPGSFSYCWTALPKLLALKFLSQGVLSGEYNRKQHMN